MRGWQWQPKKGSVNKLTTDLKDEKEPVAHARLLFKRGRLSCDFEDSRNDFEEAFALVGNMEADSMPDDEMAWLLQWMGMVHHWSYHLDAALKCYKHCSDLTSLNVHVLVLVWSFMHLFFGSFILWHICLFAHLCICSFICLLVCSFIFPLHIHSFIHSLIHSFICSFDHLLDSVVHSCFTCSVICLFVCLFI